MITVLVIEKLIPGSGLPRCPTKSPLSIERERESHPLLWPRSVALARGHISICCLQTYQLVLCKRVMRSTEMLTKGLAGEGTTGGGRKPPDYQHRGGENATVFYQAVWFFPVITLMVCPPIPDDHTLGFERVSVSGFEVKLQGSFGPRSFSILELHSDLYF